MCTLESVMGLFLSFQTGDQSRRDLTLDMANHGTMVAGIIVLNGPEDVRIINFKVTFETWYLLSLSSNASVSNNNAV